MIRVEPLQAVSRDGAGGARRGVARERIASGAETGSSLRNCSSISTAPNQLDSYRVWLRAARAVRPLPVCPTTLPSWLARSQFAVLAREWTLCAAGPLRHAARQLADARLTDRSGRRSGLSKRAVSAYHSRSAADILVSRRLRSPGPCAGFRLKARRRAGRTTRGALGSRSR